ncbi:MAG: Rieske 2Fe-2S domain-containing protein, partial [Deltaproteobacteria bacterium]|nr:Rieske 2Fe-2S domain-containing protein [Deltaproteobacteria bacterium]
MLTQAENDFFTRVGPGTPAGEWLRRFWHPIAPACEVSDDNPTRFVRLLGEDLVLFKDKRGRVGLIQHRCPHRGASLLFGRVEERGIACAYHGWLYDTQGNCLETPAEPPDSTLRLKVKPQVYPVQRFIGMYWAYLGPQPAPVIPRYKQWVEANEKLRITVYPRLDCNWFAALENALDPAHLQFLHQDSKSGLVPTNTTRGNTDDVETFDFYETPYGIMKRRFWKNGSVDEHAFNWPTYLTTGWLRTPVDDEHTLVVVVGAGKSLEKWAGARPDGVGHVAQDHAIKRVEMEDAIIEYLPPLKEPANALYPDATLYFYAPYGQIASQDHLIWETQGTIVDRTQETLGYSDRGIIMLRKLLKENINRVLDGKDPVGVIRDPHHEPIDPT